MKLWLAVLVLTLKNLTPETLGAPGRDLTDIFKPIDITLVGTYHWELIYYIDNRGKNNPFKETRRIKSTVRSSYSELTRNIEAASLSTHTSLDTGGIIRVLGATVHNSIDTTLSSSYESTIENKKDTVVTKEITREFNVGANSVGELYRLVYNGPGVTYETDIISTDSNRHLNNVTITCKVKQVPLLKFIKVVYTNQDVDMPSDAINENGGGSPDINRGFKGKYVWLVPVWASSKDDSVTGVRFVLQGKKSNDYANLASGSGGQYRYLKMLKDPTSHKRIIKVGLLRGVFDSYIYNDRHKYGYDECTTDINKDRKGDWLHLCWQYVDV